MGSDRLGRDILSRLIYGTRVSIAVAFLGAGISFLIGLTYGLFAGYSRPRPRQAADPQGEPIVAREAWHEDPQCGFKTPKEY